MRLGGRAATIRMAATRSASLGQVGVGLLRSLALLPTWVLESSDEQRTIWCESQKPSLEVVAASMLCLDTPVQCRLNREVVRVILELGTSVELERRKEEKGVYVRMELDIEDDRKLFPLKADEQAATKVNLFFRDVWSDVRRYYPKQYELLSKHSALLSGLYNDQATAAVMYCSLVNSSFGFDIEHLIVLATNQDCAKAISIVLKAMGAGQEPSAIVLCEANTLAGRGVGDIDMVEELLSRTESERVDSKAAKFDPEVLRRSIREIIRAEVHEEPVWNTIDEFFTARWLGTVNGSHSRRVHGKYGIPEVPSELSGVRLHKKAGVEIMTTNPLTEWDGRVSVGLSAKLEPGKRRAICACDTVSYMAFDWLLKPVEEVWQNVRVILDPGTGGTVGICEKVSASRVSNYKVMMDFEAFDSQHTLEAQRMVIEEATVALGDDPIRQLCIDSFEKMYIDGGTVSKGERVLGTLMSGHRATTFINSVLNAAYIRIMAGRSFDSINSYHVGDDVIVWEDNLNSARLLMRAARQSPCRFNAVKQSYGKYASEFLRTAGSGTRFAGYLARAISTAVAGNWASEIQAGEIDAGETYTRMAWTLKLRSWSDNAGLLMASTMKRRMAGLAPSSCTKVLLGTASLNGSPVVPGLEWYSVYRAKTIREVDRADARFRRLPRNATVDYLQHHLSEVELAAVRLSNTNLARLMLEASYGKSLAESGLTVEKAGSYRVTMWKRSDELPIVVGRRMLFSKGKSEWDAFPLVKLCSNGLTRRDVSVLAGKMGVPYTDSLYDELRGEESRPLCVSGLLPFTDVRTIAASLKDGATVTSILEVRM